MLEEHGWRVRHALDFSTDPDAYRDYIAGSRGEFTVAKDQNVRLRTGWFSDRSATYLAAGRPGDQPGHRLRQRLPDRRGAVRVLDDGRDPRRRSRRSTPTTSATAARREEIAREYFSHDVVLGDAARRTSASSCRSGRGLSGRSAHARPRRIPPDLRSRRSRAGRRALPRADASRPCSQRAGARAPRRDRGPALPTGEHRRRHATTTCVFTRMCLESVLAEHASTRATR